MEGLQENGRSVFENVQLRRVSFDYGKNLFCKIEGKGERSVHGVARRGCRAAEVREQRKLGFKWCRGSAF